MICACGSVLVAVLHVWRGSSLTFSRCPACGRCDFWRLRLADGAELSGEPARLVWLSLPRNGR